MRKNRLLLDEQPLIILPELARKIGLNEAIVLQQINYWLADSKHIYEGRKWVYNSYTEWQKQFPFWSINTIRRAISKLEKSGLVISGNFNKMKLDNTKWYTINHDEVDKVDTEPLNQDGQPTCSNWADENTRLDKPIPETSPKTSSNSNNVLPKIKFAEFVKMKETEYQKLVTEYGEERTKKMVAILDNYKGSKGVTYKDDYRAILSWVVKRLKEDEERGKYGAVFPNAGKNKTNVAKEGRRKTAEDYTSGEFGGFFDDDLPLGDEQVF